MYQHRKEIKYFQSTMYVSCLLHFLCMWKQHPVIISHSGESSPAFLMLCYCYFVAVLLLVQSRSIHFYLLFIAPVHSNNHLKALHIVRQSKHDKVVLDNSGEEELSLNRKS